MGGFDRFLKASKKIAFLKKASQALSPPVMLGDRGAAMRRYLHLSDHYFFCFYFLFLFAATLASERMEQRGGRVNHRQTGLRLRQRQVGVVTLKT